MEFEIIETDRLLLRKLTPQVLNHIFENYPEGRIRELLGLVSDQQFEKERDKYRKGYSTYNRSLLFFQIVDKSTRRIIGGCGFHNWFADHRRAELGYNLADEDFKRRGIMTEALKAVIDYGFEIMQLHRIEALVGSENTPSLKLMEHYGFEREGLLREHYYINGKFEDSVAFARLNPNR